MSVGRPIRIRETEAVVAVVVVVAVAPAVFVMVTKPVGNNHHKMTLIPNWFMNSSCY